MHMGSTHDQSHAGVVLRHRCIVLVLHAWDLARTQYPMCAMPMRLRHATDAYTVLGQRLYSEVRRALRGMYIQLPAEQTPAAARSFPVASTSTARSSTPAAAPPQSLPRWFSYSVGASLRRTQTAEQRISDPGELPGPHGGKQVHIQPRSRSSVSLEAVLPQVGHLAQGVAASSQLLATAWPWVEGRYCIQKWLRMWLACFIQHPIGGAGDVHAAQFLQLITGIFY